ncbi:MAG: hypothetical protein ACT4QF_20665 [Sporichthyaceae bacterium]
MSSGLFGTLGAGLVAAGILVSTMGGCGPTAPVAVEPAANGIGTQGAAPNADAPAPAPTAATTVQDSPAPKPKPKPKPSVDEASVAYCDRVSVTIKRSLAGLDESARALRLGQTAEAGDILDRIGRKHLAAANAIAKFDTKGVSKNVRTDVALLVASIRREESKTFSPSDIGKASSADIASVLEDDCDLHRKARDRSGPALDM